MVGRAGDGPIAQDQTALERNDPGRRGEGNPAEGRHPHRPGNDAPAKRPKVFQKSPKGLPWTGLGGKTREGNPGEDEPVKIGPKEPSRPPKPGRYQESLSRPLPEEKGTRSQA